MKKSFWMMEQISFSHFFIFSFFTNVQETGNHAAHTSIHIVDVGIEDTRLAM